MGQSSKHLQSTRSKLAYAALWLQGGQTIYARLGVLSGSGSFQS